MSTRIHDLRSAAPAVLEQGLRLIQDEQLTNGEIPNYQCMKDESWQYCFSPAISAYIYDELSCFDPLSTRFESQAVEWSEGFKRLSFLRSVAHIRQKIRRFLAWQESSTGGWRFYGQASGLPPDVDLTACAATVFVDSDRSSHSRAVDRRVADLERFRTAAGTFASPRSREEPPINPALQWMANCNVLRFFALSSGDTDSLEALILGALRSGELLLDDALPLQYAAAKAWSLGRLSSFPSLSSWLLPLALRRPGCAGPLSAALAVLVLLDLDAPEKTIAVAISEMLNWWSFPLNRKFETYCSPHCGSPALTAAFTMAAVVRSAAI